MDQELQSLLPLLGARMERGSECLRGEKRETPPPNNPTPTPTAKKMNLLEDSNPLGHMWCQDILVLLLNGK